MKKENPLKKYKTLDNACRQVGFDIVIPSRYKIKEIYVIDNRTLELRFASLTIRKAKYDKNSNNDIGISGIYEGAYPNDCYKNEFTNNSARGYEYWNGSSSRPKAYLAIWSDNELKYSYSVYAKDGITTTCVKPKCCSLGI